MNLKFSLTLSIVLFIASFLGAQENDFITGKLLDAKTQEPIAFASIRIKDRALGVISNIDGSFRIPMKYKEYGDIIEISSMGYQTQEFFIHDFSIYELNNVRLQPAIFELSEAVVKAKRRKKNLSARKIVQRAIDAIPENYPIDPHSLVGYYRDYQWDNDDYLNLNEVILEVFDQGYNAIDSATTKVLLYDYRKNQNFKRDTLASKPYSYSYKGGAKIIDKGYLDSYGGNEFTILSVHNAIRNNKIDSYSFVHQFSTDLLKEHRFKREDDSSIGDEKLYTVRFDKNITNYSAYGRLYISKYDYSIYKMEYAVYDDAKNNATGLKDENGSNKRVIFEVNTSYRKKEGKMFLNYISFHNNFTVKTPPALKLNYVDFRMNYKRMSQRRANLKVDEEVRNSHFELTFTNKLDTKYAMKLRNYKAKLQGEQVRFDSIMVMGKKVKLYPKIKQPIQRQMLKDIELLAVQKRLNRDVLEFNLKNLRDVHGNIINQWKTKDYEQFREFFVQQVKKKPIRPKDELFMKKDRPIFKNQPRAKPDNFEDYWMNTPLKTKGRTIDEL